MRQFLLFLCLALGAFQCPVYAQSLAETVTYSEQRMNEAREHLNAVRDAIFAEKGPLMEEWTELQASVISLRREADTRDSTTSGLRTSRLVGGSLPST